MIIGELLTGVRILLEKAPSGYNISEDQQLTENIPKLLFFQKKEPAKRGGRGEPPWALPIGRRGHQARRAATWGGGPRPPSAISLSRTSSTRNPKVQGRIENRHSRLCGAENTREKRALRQAEICPGNSLPEGKIVAIVTVIELDFIGIIIIIISTTDTVISTAAPRLRCNI